MVCERRGRAVAVSRLGVAAAAARGWRGLGAGAARRVRRGGGATAPVAAAAA
jgi:hypothetical protein